MGCIWSEEQEREVHPGFWGRTCILFQSCGPWIAAKVPVLRERLFRQNEATPVWNAESQDPTDPRICIWTFLWLTGTVLEKYSFKVYVCVTFQNSEGRNSKMVTGTAWTMQIQGNTSAGWARTNLRTGQQRVVGRQGCIYERPGSPFLFWSSWGKWKLTWCSDCF